MNDLPKLLTVAVTRTQDGVDLSAVTDSVTPTTVRGLITHTSHHITHAHEFDTSTQHEHDERQKHAGTVRAAQAELGLESPGVSGSLQSTRSVLQSTQRSGASCSTCCL